MKILLNFSDYTHTPERKKQNTYGGVGYYRIVKPSEQIDGHEVKVIGKEILHFGDSLEEQWANVFKEYDVYWTSYFCDPEAGAAIFYNAQKYNKKVIIDIDDNYLDVPESNLLYEKFKKTKKDRAFLSTILSFADALTVSTEPLKERLFEHIKEIHGIEKDIYVIPNCNDLKDWQHERVTLPKNKITIGYTGSNSHHDDLRLVLPAINKLMAKYPNLYFEMLGIVAKKDVYKFFKGFSKDKLDRMNLVPATPTFKEYPEWLSKQKWDIGIAPLVDTPFTRSKSHIKWLEYSMYKIPTVASRVYPYFMELNGKKTIEDGVTGFLCKPNEWETKLEKLILDKELRDKIGQQSYDHVVKEWQYKDSNIKVVADSLLKKLYPIT